MSKIKIKKFSKENANKNEVEEVFKIAKKLEDYLNEKETEKNNFLNRNSKSLLNFILIF